jgi:tetrahydromethanopterin S-methyltransferase subunit A
MNDELEDKMYSICNDYLPQHLAKDLAQNVTWQARKYANALSTGKIGLGIMIGITLTLILLKWLA